MITNYDFEMARKLQSQFDFEYRTENPSNDLVYDDKRKKKKEKSIKSPSKCLVDPSWELVDPTPNIHILFVQFNERFFWNKLLPVTVSWSKRMTVCAGVCSYQGRGGLCSITLSEPLLKLRPRKDLVETLLHEMIHAYLFVTHNNKDRDGHGPEFHKHMYRINDEAGTNITVYHDFHDEVRLYQQHWWRCDGPCQKRPPYFGMVRRSMNRAPGPNDFWWAEHQKTCGGNFVKVKEPEKPPKKIKSSKGNTKAKPVPTSPLKKTPNNLPDIRNFLPIVDSNSVPKPSGKENIQTLNAVKNVGGSLGTKNKNGTVVLNPKASKKSFNDPSITSVIPSSNNIKGFSSTEPSNSKKNIDIFSGTGRKLSDSSNNKNVNESNPIDAVRNHWINKFDNNNQDSSKRKSKTNEVKPTKKVKIKEPNKNTACPNCNKLIPEKELDAHINKCFNADSSILSEFSDDSFKLVECPVCQKMIDDKLLNSHLDDCLAKEENNKNDILEINDLENDNFTHCEICNKNIPSEHYTVHISECLYKCYDNTEDKLEVKTTNDDSILCLVCNKLIKKSELNLHLEDCMDSVFEKNINEGDTVEEDKNEENEDIKKDREYNCPICMSSINESNMNTHIDECLNIVALKNNVFD